jgi:hypothetical protein
LPHLLRLQAPLPTLPTQRPPTRSGEPLFPHVPCHPSSALCGRKAETRTGVAAICFGGAWRPTCRPTRSAGAARRSLLSLGWNVMVDPAFQRSLRRSKECDVKLPKDSYLNYLKPMVLRNLEHASEPMEGSVCCEERGLRNCKSAELAGSLASTTIIPIRSKSCQPLFATSVSNSLFSGSSVDQRQAFNSVSGLFEF